MAQQPTLRVMRLYKPSLYYVASTSPFITPEAQFNFPLSNFLMFPDSFGDLFVGETFKAYIAVINTLNAPKEALVNTTLSIKIQTSSSSHELFDSSKDSVGGAELQEGASLSQVISYAISEIGTHTLRVVVQYEAKETSQERVTMKKLYRFNVLSPLSVRAAVLPPKTTPLATVFPLQLTLTNATAQTMSIAEVKLAVSPSSDMEIISAPMGPTGTQELYQPHKELKPDEAHSFSFLLTVRSMKNTHFSGLFTEALALGRPVIYWNHVFGSGGVYYGETIQYVPPKRIPGSTPPLNVLCISSPSKVQVGEEFTLLLRFSASQVIEENLFELRMDFSNENTGLICIGSSRVEVPTLSNGTFVDVPLTLCCTEGGLTKCEFLYLFNRRTSAKYPVGRLCTVVSCTDFAQ